MSFNKNDIIKAYFKNKTLIQHQIEFMMII